MRGRRLWAAAAAIMSLGACQSVDASSAPGPSAAPDDLALLQPLFGCWAGRRSDGRPVIVLIEGSANAIKIKSGIDCSLPSPLLEIFERSGRVWAEEDDEVAVIGHNGLRFRWVVQTATSNELLLVPELAPVTLRFKLASPDRMLWSSTRSEPGQTSEDVVLERTR